MAKSNSKGEKMAADSLADMVLGFFEEDWAAGSDEGWVGSGDEPSESAQARAFYQSQDQLLQGALRRIGPTETRIQGSVAAAARLLSETAAGSECPLRVLSQSLREMGYDSAVCRSKWRRSPDIPPGEHRYVDIIMRSRTGLKEPTRIIIEPNFRGEFAVARASQEFNFLVAQLPETFVGKPERLKSVVKIMCRAAKRCMKDNKMHMGPWRKHEYMLSKWFGTCHRLSAPLPPGPEVVAGGARTARSRASLLTFDLLMPAVEVV